MGRFRNGAAIMTFACDCSTFAPTGMGQLEVSWPPCLEYRPHGIFSLLKMIKQRRNWRN